MVDARARRLSPAGRGALAVWRVTAGCGLGLTSRTGAARAWPAPGEAAVARLVADGEVLDEIVAIGVDSRAHEVCLHGGEGVERRLRAALARVGATIEEPRASGPGCLRAAVAEASSRAGCLRTFVDGLAARPADDAAARSRAERCLALTTFAERLVRPPTIRLVGRPNAGKSTLFNALLGRRRALVSPVEGTTRDAVTAPWVLRGVPVMLEDTAGREAAPQGADGGPGVLVVAVTSGASVPAGGDPVVRTHADVRDRTPAGPGVFDVSGTSGAGLAALRDGLAERLGIPEAAEGDVWVPIRASDRARLADWLARSASSHD